MQLQAMEPSGAGAGYGTKWGVINHVYGDNAPNPSELSLNEIEYHIIGVILANQYNLKKDEELVGERANMAVMTE